jgi:4-hydroxyphenylpyruvate dioxygenase-like putative hemolysin
VVETGKPSWSRGLSKMRPEKNYYELERVRLPLASDGKTVDIILSLTVFFDSEGNEILKS